MQVVTGKIIQKGIAIGPLRVFHEEKTAVTVRSGRTPAEEWGRFEAACERAKEQLVALYERALAHGAQPLTAPKEATLGLREPVKARLAFVTGVSGEQIELFCVHEA